MSYTQTPHITICIVNYNAGSMLAECLHALLAQEMSEFKVIVVDNASTDDSLENLPQDPRLSVIKNTDNVGFAAANNQALLEADTPWVATLNPDTKPDKHWLTALLEAAEKNPDVIMFGSSQLSAADASIGDGFGDEYFCTGIGWRKGNGTAAPDPLPGGEVFAPCAAAAMYHTDWFKKAGGFCERYFCYIEDMDMAFRLRLQGGECLQVADAIVYHHGYAITGNRSDFTMFHCTRNMVWTYLRCMPWPLLLITLPFHIGMMAFIFLWSFKHGKSKPVGRGIRSAIAGIPQSLRERREIQRTRTTSWLTIARAMVWNPLEIIRWRSRVAKRNHRTFSSPLEGEESFLSEQVERKENLERG